MEPSQLNWIANFIWSIADDVLRDLYVRGKYRDVVLPMTVLRRFDAVLEPSKQAVLDMKASLDKVGITNQDQALRQAASQAFYNTSKFTLRDLRARASQQQLKADFEAYLDGFSPNVQEILENFEFRNQIPRLSKADALGTLPLNMFYNTGIATYIWVLTNRKAAHRKGTVQLIDATQWSKPLRKNLGKKNCELSEDDIARICDTFLNFEETEQSRIFPNAALGYWKVTVERPLRLRGIDPNRAYTPKEIKALKESHERDETVPPIIRKIHKRGTEPDPLRGLFEVVLPSPSGRGAGGEGRRCVVEYEPDSDLRDTEQIPLLEDGGIEAFIRREVLPHAPDAWIDELSIKIGYEISFTRYFYKPQPLRTLDEIRADIRALEKETEGLLSEIVEGSAS